MDTNTNSPAVPSLPKAPAKFLARRPGPPQSRGPILGRGKGGGVGGKGRTGMRTGVR